MTAMTPNTKPAPHFHLGGTEMNHGTYWSLDEAETAVEEQATKWLQRYGESAVTVQQGYTAVWRNGVRIDYRTAFACTNPHCAPKARVLPYPVGSRYGQRLSYRQAA